MHFYSGVLLSFCVPKWAKSFYRNSEEIVCILLDIFQNFLWISMKLHFLIDPICALNENSLLFRVTQTKDKRMPKSSKWKLDRRKICPQYYTLGVGKLIIGKLIKKNEAPFTTRREYIFNNVRDTSCVCGYQRPKVMLSFFSCHYTICHGQKARKNILLEGLWLILYAICQKLEGSLFVTNSKLCKNSVNRHTFFLIEQINFFFLSYETVFFCKSPPSFL